MNDITECGSCGQHVFVRQAVSGRYLAHHFVPRTPTIRVRCDGSNARVVLA